MPISDRLRQLAYHAGSQSNLAKKAGLRSQVISRIINKGAGIHSDTILAIAKAYPDLNLEWFITGEGPMWKPKSSISSEAPKSDKEKEGLKDEIIALQRTQLNLLKRAIREKAPELGADLNLEE